MNHSEQSIINGLKRGDSWAYKHIYDCHYTLLYRVAFSFIKDTFLTQALIEDLIIDIYEKREALDENLPLRPYLMRAIVNDCLNYLSLKRQKMEVKLSSVDISDDHLFAVRDQNDSPLLWLLEKELGQEIRLAVDRLPVECRTVFEKSYFEGKSNQKIATELAISINTVKYHIKKALSRLRKDLEKFLLMVLGCFSANFIF